MKQTLATVIVLLSGAAVTTPAAAQSGVLDGPWIGCLTETTWDQMSGAIANGDDRLRDSLIGTTCTVLDGQEFSVLGRVRAGLSQIRVYVDDTHIDLIVPVEATR